MRKNFVLLLLCIAGIAQAQRVKKADRELVSNLQKEIRYLSSDSLEGRRTGTAGEKLAMQYISNDFQSIGLQPKGTNQYFQPFTIDEGKQINPGTHLSINGRSLELGKDFYPLAYSANDTIAAAPSVTLQEVHMPWFFDSKDLIQENSGNPHFDVYTAVKDKAAEMQKKGATALFIYNTGTGDELQFESKDNAPALTIPVVYITKEAAKKYLSDELAALNINLKVDIGEKVRTGSNVMGYIDNGAATTVVIGAHFDHLGYGEDGNSLWRGARQIHNGADDNASGTAAMIELARLLKSSKLKENNYLFIAFTGEELGLYGSKYFTQHPTIDLGTVNYMINMDMVGRLNDSSHMVYVGGYGTSPTWGQVYSATGKKGLYSKSLIFKYDSSGVGPSDHTSFYLKDIPVLFYFTGLHSDYHKPSDDFDKVNYEGEMEIVKHIYSLIEQLNKTHTRVAFTKTRDAQMADAPHFSVTLGILPDYTFTGKGLRVDDVSADRPAQKAGLKAGDIITALGSYKVSDIQSYMQALSNYKKTEKTIISFQRGNETLQSTVQF